MRGIGVAAVVGIGLAALAQPASSAPAPNRRIEASASAAELIAALLPEGTDQAWTVCDGDCPPGVGRLDVSDPRLDLKGAAVQARGKVRTEVALVGRVEADVVCVVAPILLDAARVHVQSRGCRIERLGAGISPWLRAGVVAAVEPALAAVLDDQLRRAPPYDLLAGARDGLLAPYAADPALRPPVAARCVDAIRSVGVRDGAPGRLVVGVDVGCSR